MDFVCNPVFTPLRVLVVNPLSCAAQLSITKIMSGVVFGTDQLIDLILLVYSNERAAAEDLKLELHSCGFCCMNTITVSTELPLISDADIFCFITNFRNPNTENFTDIDNQEFDVLYLIIKIAKSLGMPKPVVKEDTNEEKDTKKDFEEKKPIKPIIMTDGVIAMNIIRYLAKDLPCDSFFCPTPLPAMARKVLGEEMKVHACNINKMLVWGANDAVFHIEVQKPVVTDEKIDSVNHCDFEVTTKKAMKVAGLDNTQFNEKWMKKDFIDKVYALASKNPYGYIFRAADFTRTLAIVWRTRAANAVGGSKVYANIGVISDGSLETMKGYAYVLPVIFSGDTWCVNKCCEESFQVQQEIKRINKAVKQLKENLLPYCKRFLEDNIINQAFIPPSEASDTIVSIAQNLRHSQP